MRIPSSSLKLGAHTPESYGSHFVCVCMCVCVCLLLHYFCYIIHLYVTTTIVINFKLYFLHFNKGYFL